MTCRLCNQGLEESQEHLEECTETLIERQMVKYMSTEKDKIVFWRGFTAKIYEKKISDAKNNYIRRKL